MSGEPERDSALVSRRLLLQSAAAAAAAATMITASSNRGAAAVKISQKAVNYQDHPDGDKRCDKCAQFQPPSSCKMVDGTISPQGSCRIFMLIRQTLRRSWAVPSPA